MEQQWETVIDFYTHQHVLVTGGTGFMGKVLIEKLLREVPNIGKIYVLIRPKKGKDPRTRIEEILQSPYSPFVELNKKHPDRLKKVEPLTGNIEVPGFGLSESDMDRIINEVSIVFHMAANVKFDTPLKEAILTNTSGIMNVMDVAKNMRCLKSFIYVSTAYCHPNEIVVEERHYPPLMSPEKVLSIIHNVDDAVIDGLTMKILGEHPNTYSFSKNLSEDIVTRSGVPAGIARPSIVGACYKEPAGWVDNLNGATGLFAAFTKGVVFSFYGDSKVPSNIVPCDYAVNGVIVLAWKVGLEKRKETIFLNLAPAVENALNWEYISKHGQSCMMAYPSSAMLWYPQINMTSSLVKHTIIVTLFQLFPAIVLDFLLYLTGNKPFLTRVQRKLSIGFKLLTFYTTKNWRFQDDQMKVIESQLQPSDRALFPMNTKDVNWKKYLYNYSEGGRYYCLKDDPSTLPQGRRLVRFMYCLDKIVKMTFYFWIARILYHWILLLINV